MKKNQYFILLLSVFLFSIPALSQTGFLDSCKINENLRRDLNNKLGTKSCDEINLKLLHIRSFSEIIFSDKNETLKRKILSAPWTDDFPFLYGLNKRLSEKTLMNEGSVNLDEVYKTLQDFKEFNNIDHISYLREYPYYKGPSGICNILKDFPSIKTVTIEWRLLLSKKADLCLSKHKAKIIIRDQFKGFDFYKPKSSVIGIEYFNGDLRNISNLRSLKYIGLANSTKALDGIESIYKLEKISHFSINIKSLPADLTKIKFLGNLEYLNIVCAVDESLNSINPEPCNASSTLRTIDFLKDLSYLKHLNLSFNGLDDLTPIENLKELIYLKLRRNNLKEVPSLSGFSRLQYLDLSGNKLDSLPSLKGLKSLYFLNISGNNIKTLDSLSSLPSLKFLNASYNPNIIFDKKDSTLDNIDVININGSNGNFNLGSVNELIKTFPNISNEFDRDLVIETIFHDVIPGALELKKCQSLPTTIDEDIFSHFPNAKIIFAKSNNFKNIPNLRKNTKLVYLDLSLNNISELDLQDNETIEYLRLESNNLTSFPEITNLKSLKWLSLSQNMIEDIHNLNSLPLNLKSIDLMNNIIRDLSPLISIPSTFENHHLLAFQNNLIPKDKKYCPSNVDYILKQDCEYFLNGLQLGNVGIQRPIFFFDKPEYIDVIESLRCK